MIGIHLHDIKGLDDHIPPGKGEVEYREIIPFLSPSMIKILEINYRVAKRDLLEGVSFIEKKIGDIAKDG